MVLQACCSQMHRLNKNAAQDASPSTAPLCSSFYALQMLKKKTSLPYVINVK